MATGDPVASNEAVVRYAKPSEISAKTVNGSIFHRRDPQDHDGVSVCRMGVLCAEPDKDLVAIRAVMNKVRNLRPTGGWARIPASAFEQVGKEQGQPLKVVQSPELAKDGKPANPAHAHVEGLPFKGRPEGSWSAERAGDLLRLHVTHVYPNKDPVPETTEI